VECLALDVSNLELQLRRLATPIRVCKRSRAPWGPAMHLFEIGKEGECVRVSERDEDDAVVGECAHGSKCGGLLATPKTGRGDEQASVFS